MFDKSTRRIIVCGLFLMSYTEMATAADIVATEAFCHDWFGQSAHAAPMTLSNTNIIVNTVTLDGHPSGWIFRTDQVPPSCKGKRGQITVLVAIGTDARIKGLSVIAHREDPQYFRRFKKSFFSQFTEIRADDTAVKIDAVTRATLSSRAIIRDVMEGAKNVIALPEVAAQLNSLNKGG